MMLAPTQLALSACSSLLTRVCLTAGNRTEKWRASLLRVMARCSQLGVSVQRLVLAAWHKGRVFDKQLPWRPRTICLHAAVLQQLQPVMRRLVW